MSTDDQELEALRAAFPGVRKIVDGGAVLALLPILWIRTRDGLVERKALLNPRQDGGYTTRLYLDEQVTAPNARNWQPVVKAGSTWWVCSWNQVPASLPWFEILAAHLGAYA